MYSTTRDDQAPETYGGDADFQDEDDGEDSGAVQYKPRKPRKRNGKKKNTRYFAKVTPADWTSGDTCANLGERNGLERRRRDALRTVVLSEEPPADRILVQPAGLSEPVFVGNEYIRVSLAAQPLAALQKMTSWLLQMKLIKDESLYDLYDKLVDNDGSGGHSILLSLLLHEPDDVLVKGFMALEYLKPRHERTTVRTVLAPGMDFDGDRPTTEQESDGEADDDDLSAEKKSSPSSALVVQRNLVEVDHDVHELTVPILPPTVEGNGAVAPIQFAIPAYSEKDLIVNLGAPFRESEDQHGGARVLTRLPLVSIDGLHDSLPDNAPVPICGPEVSAWMAKTANERQRDRPKNISDEDYETTVSQYDAREDKREEIAALRRDVCPTTMQDVEYALAQQDAGESIEEPIRLDPEAVDQLRQLGWSDDRLRALGYI